MGVCRVHFVRNVLARVPKGRAETVAAAIRTIFPQPDAEHVRDQLQVNAGNEWQVSDRRYLSEGSIALLNPALAAQEVAGRDLVPA